MKYHLVTGGAGFIGSNLVEALVKLGKKVRVLDNFSTGLEENLESVENKIEILRGDIRNPDTVAHAMRDAEFVFHVAANRAVLQSVENPKETHEVNVTGTLNLLEAAKEEGVKRFVFSSSSAVYGDTKKFPSRESDELFPQSPYAVSKWMGECYCRLYSEMYGLDTVSLRYFNAFGPRQNPESRYSTVIPIFADCLMRGESPEIHWDGKQSRDFVYIDNIVKANLLAVRGPRRGGAVYNISSGEELSVLEIYQILARELKSNGVKPRFAPKRAGDVRRTLADIRKAEQELNYQPGVFFDEGIRRTLKWFRQKREGEQVKI